MLQCWWERWRGRTTAADGEIAEDLRALSAGHLSGHGRLACRARLRRCRPAAVGRLPAVARVASA
eukprot:15240763-Alexandrium_andersonii.AAC.1